jgi:hypothetical protein
MSGTVKSRPSFDGTIYETKQGGFSDEVFEAEYLQKYMKGVPNGYIGSSYRRAWADKLVEAALRKTGLGPNGIAVWLTSTSARHLADKIGKDRGKFGQLAISDTEDAFLDVAI